MPGQPLTSFDIGFVNGQGIYALADRANHGVDLIEAATGRPIATVGGFKGYDKAKGFSEAGPDGVVAVGRGEFWAGDGDSTVKVIDVARRAVVATISTGGHKRVDEMTYDPRDHLVVVVNNADEPPFVSFISSRTRKVLGKLALPRATDGAEQPVWNPATGLLYLSIPVLDHVEANGAVAVIDPRSFKLLRMLPVSKCMPAGLAAGPRGELLLGCSDDAIGAGFPAQSMIMDPRSGRILTTIAEVGGSDEVWYDPHAGNYYLAAAKMPGGPVLGVVNAHTRRWVANLPTGGHAHSVAADPRTGRIFVPIDVHTGGGTCPGGCIAVFAPAKR
ncbi:MAG: cytochrome C nitrite reductase [Gammaproteobacteria bacterium]|nr:cytochrome C nitrite reductase [Gammaproteobacteria bacterium]